jgi:hypothetical protein
MQDYVSGILGIKTATLIAAFLGAVVSLSYVPELTRWRLFTSVFAGTSVSVYGVPIATHYAGIPDSLERAIAFFAGLLAMRMVPVLFHLVDRFKGVHLPSVPDEKE